MADTPNFAVRSAVRASLFDPKSHEIMGFSKFALSRFPLPPSPPGDVVRKAIDVQNSATAPFPSSSTPFPPLSPSKMAKEEEDALNERLEEMPPKEAAIRSIGDICCWTHDPLGITECGRHARYKATWHVRDNRLRCIPKTRIMFRVTAYCRAARFPHCAIGNLRVTTNPSPARFSALIVPRCSRST